MLREFAVLLITNLAFGVSEPLFEDEEKRLYNFGLGKRAYSYVSEYKRLPVYNFGLGKRAEGKSMYAFGLGKRDDEEFRNDGLYDSVIDKRGKSYDFGLGKRLASGGYNFGLGKKAEPQYSFGLGKRLGHYNFGLGKRQGKYSFDLGKKDKVYSFGLGKRYNYLSADDDDEVDYDDNIDEEKRGQKYSFGLGKRDNLLEDTDEDDIHSERQARETRYDFVLGKSNVKMELPLKSISQSENKDNRRDDSKKFDQ